MQTGLVWLLAAVAALPGEQAMAADDAPFDIEVAIAAFRAGEAEAPMVFDNGDVSRCNGRWVVHADAVDEGAFPAEARARFPHEFRLPYAITAMEFFSTDQPEVDTMFDAQVEAKRLLRPALAGDKEATRHYFDDLGRCSLLAETVRDTSDLPRENAEEGVVESSEKPREGDDFDAPAGD